MSQKGRYWWYQLMLCLSTHISANTFGNVCLLHCSLWHQACEKELKHFLRFYFTLFKCATVIMEMNWEYLHLNTKPEAIHLCEVCDSSKSETGQLYVLTSSTLSTILKKNDKVWLVVLCDGRSITLIMVFRTSSITLLMYAWLFKFNFVCYVCQAKKWARMWEGLADVQKKVDRTFTCKEYILI